MSRFISNKYSTLIPYTPGEQPKDTQYVKLNTNESPFPPSPSAVAMAAQAAGSLQLYSDPECPGCRKPAALLGSGMPGIGEDRRGYIWRWRG